jgi:hypothetical protein
MQDLITMKDANGNFVTLRYTDIFECLKVKRITLFGLDIPTIAELRHQYLLRGGQTNATPETVKEIFSSR